MALYSPTYCRSMIAKYQAALEKTLDAQSYSINGRSISRIPHSEAAKQLEIWQQRLQESLGNNGSVLCRGIIVHDC